MSNASRIRKINTTSRDTPIHLVAEVLLLPTAEYRGIEVSANGTLYVSNNRNDAVHKVFEDGRLEGAIAGSISASGDALSTGLSGSDGNTARFESPIGITVDNSDVIYLSDTGNHRIKRLTPHGRVQSLAGTGSSGDVVGDVGSDVKFSSPQGIAVDEAGIVYVADTSNHKIKKIFPSGRTVSLAGAGDGFANGQGSAARFNSPRDVAVDRAGNVYVADTGNNRIRKITPDGVVTTLAGATASGTADGDGFTARFVAPGRLAFDPSNQFLFVMEDPSGAEAVRRVDMHGNTTTFASWRSFSGSYGDLTVDNSGNLYLIECDSA